MCSAKIMMRWQIPNESHKVTVKLLDGSTLSDPARLTFLVLEESLALLRERLDVANGLQL